MDGLLFNDQEGGSSVMPPLLAGFHHYASPAFLRTCRCFRPRGSCFSRGPSSARTACALRTISPKENTSRSRTGFPTRQDPLICGLSYELQTSQRPWLLLAEGLGWWTAPTRSRPPRSRSQPTVISSGARRYALGPRFRRARQVNPKP